MILNCKIGHVLVVFAIVLVTVNTIYTSKDSMCFTKRIIEDQMLILNRNKRTRTNNDDGGGGDLKSHRMLKYFQHYRYLPAAPRFDYNPYPAKECGQGPEYDAFFKLNGKQRSRLGEDKFIYDTFFKHTNASKTDDDNNNRTTTTEISSGGGTYVEIGAYNGLQESNSRFFDTCLGWKGLLVEGNPISYQQVLANREFAHKMSFAPSCDLEYERVNRTIQFSRYPMTNAGLKGYAKTYDAKPMVDVPCGPFSPVLEDVFEGGPINFFSLDVEGAEIQVLETIDFTKVHVDVFMIEIENNYCRAPSCVVRKLVREKMKKEGYKRYEKLVHASDIYVHAQSRFQIPASVAVPSTS